ncbi:CHAT domain-containing protein, partial [Anabaena sp. UHCC 0204]|uniref:CHAT domain-containing protein n=1 Tax=Anabaena sp. UHCC 0204 TaxID=2590009 RepID=UPI0014469E1B
GNLTIAANTNITADTDSDGIGNFALNGTLFNTNNNPLTIIAADVQLDGVLNLGSANLTLQPSTDNNTVGIGSGATGIFNLNTTDLTNITTTGNVTIGRMDNTGVVNIAASGNPLDLSGIDYNLIVIGGGGLNINSNITTENDQTYDGDINLSNNTVLEGKNIALNGNINASTNGGQSLTVNGSGNTTLGSDDTQEVGGINRLSSLTMNGAGTTTIKTNAVNTTGNQTYNNGVIVGSDTTINSSNNSNVAFNNTIDSDGTPRSLTINAGGLTSFNDSIGNTSSLFSLTTDVGGTIAINTTSIKTAGDQTYGELMSLGSDVVLESTDNGNITFNDQVDSGGGIARNLTVNTGGITRFNNAVGDNNPLNSLTTNIEGSTEINNNVTTTGTAGQTYNDQVKFTNNAIITSNALNFGNDVSGVGVELTILPVTATQAITLGGTSNDISGVLTLNKSEIDFFQDGFNLITFGRVDGSGLITLTGDVTFKDPVVVRSPIGSGAINGTNANITGTGDASVTLQANQDIVTGNISTQGQAISITTPNGKVTTGSLITSSTTGNGGDVTLQSFGNINTGNINSSSTFGEGGKIDITITDRNIPVELLTAEILSTGLVATGNIDSSGITGGDITIQPFSSLITGNLNSSGTFGKAGDVTLGLSNQIIQIGSIKAESISNQGGNVDISALVYFIAKDSFTSLNGQKASISTLGLPSSGVFSLLHGASILQVGTLPIDSLGNITGSGTKDAIIVGETRLSNINIPGNFSVPNINIVSQEPPPNVPRTALLSGSLGLAAPNNTDVSPRGETKIHNEVSSVLGINVRELSDTEIQSRLTKIVGIKPAIIEAFFKPDWNFPQGSAKEQDSDKLYLAVITANSQKIEKPVPGVTRKNIKEIRQNYLRRLQDANLARSDSKSYLNYSQELYNALIKPIAQDLVELKVDTLSFVMDTDLRSLPIAALHDGERFIFEKYKIGIMPSTSLTLPEKPESYDVRQTQILAMGASEFDNINPSLDPLPAVPIELNTITNIWLNNSSATKSQNSKPYYLNKEYFTIDNFIKARSLNQFRMIHLATHGKFEGGLKNSYIQFGDGKVTLDNLATTLNLNSSPFVELMVLSACETAIADKEAEMGFAGIAVKAGVKSVLASLWSVDDAGTLALMVSFYKHLQSNPIKVEALRLAQLDMMTGKVQFKDGYIVINDERIEKLPPDLEDLKDIDFKHPYYWSAFTMIGNFW